MPDRSNPSQTDWLLIERVLYGLWAPNDRDPSEPAEVLNDMGDPQLSINDVIRSRRALERLRKEPTS